MPTETEPTRRDEQTAIAAHDLFQFRLRGPGEPDAVSVAECMMDLFRTQPGLDVSDKTASLSLVHRANIPKRHQIRELRDTGAEVKAWTRARDRVVGQLGGGFLIALIGPRGTGKTQIAQQAVVRSSSVGRASLYLKAMDVFLWLRAALGNDAPRTQLEAVAELIRPPLLIIDEIQ
ncbi:MAG TPA: ATP-binding protein, partial [Phycisphaerae bacterium]|nr:ATP-binding protein [Phycisphaerae bacterium]